MGTLLSLFFVALLVIGIWMLVCGGIGILWALVENSVGGGLLGGFILWIVSFFFLGHAWNDLSAAWWGVIIGAIWGLYLTYQDVKYLF